MQVVGNNKIFRINYDYLRNIIYTIKIIIWLWLVDIKTKYMFRKVHLSYLIKSNTWAIFENTFFNILWSTFILPSSFSHSSIFNLDFKGKLICMVLNFLHLSHHNALHELFSICKCSKPLKSPLFYVAQNYFIYNLSQAWKDSNLFANEKLIELEWVGNTSY